jgi:uncharacterized membrane protein
VSLLLKPSVNWLLVFVPVSVVADLVIHQPVLIFAASALAIVPLAGLIGTSTEQLAIRVGPGLGGLLNASAACDSSSRRSTSTPPTSIRLRLWSRLAVS